MIVLLQIDSSALHKSSLGSYWPTTSEKIQLVFTKEVLPTNTFTPYGALIQGELLIFIFSIIFSYWNISSP